MLKLIKIKDFALIESLELELDKEMVAITGETGVGKSLLLDAISSLMGSKCNTMNIRSGAKKYQLEAIYDISKNPKAIEWLNEKGIEHDGLEIYLKKELFSDGKSRIQIGGSLAPSQFLKELGSLLSEIHRQNDQLFLLEKSMQLEYLDGYAGLTSLKKEVSERFKTYQTLKNRISEIDKMSSDKNHRIEILKYQIKEIQSAKLQLGEEEELLQDEQMLIHGEKIVENYNLIADLLNEGEENILKSFSKILNAADKIETVTKDFSTNRNQLYEIYEQLKDISHTVIDQKDEIFFSSDRLSIVQNRLDEINKLKRKYGKDISAILDFLEKAKIELESLEISSDEVISLQKELDSMRDNLTNLAVKLSHLRRDSILKLESDLQKEFQLLGMKDAKLQIVMRWEQAIDGEVTDGGKKYILNENGLDQIDFYFSANQGEKPRPLRKIISGGEMSRVMLAMKTILGNNNEPRLLVFDEIDAGIGGEVAYRVADKLKSISEKNQVLLITHLQQIAAVSDCHIKVEKDIMNGRTFTIARKISDSERAKELAKMIAGEHITKGALDHAKELLKKAV
ncbi:MAG TPA: DNA repair protein RecN [Leptospiraceae bacterium]|nr:DNA repair protein RecN [Leptospiraceae bacterium]HMW04846.1 DNA repair protein RecN [Leptospiraceae bacterium]HMX34733.1 DNA repair protein RecN [Leptospiraceae bacterium]HMY30406.1 DNA repair protein RecN [Leptospiraceae bacterium]HMZ64640.1 DNA repair protein RecN [Leptospiraceae bacterium]